MGFTLIELLAVVFIVAILAAILFPVLARAKESAKQTDCLSRLHQAGVALALYTEDHGDYPAWILPPIGPDPGGKLLRSTSALSPYIPKGSNTLVCPFDRAEGRIQAPKDRELPRSYAQTWFLWEGIEGREAWQALLQADSNPIVFRCHFHTHRVRAFLTHSDSLNFFGSLEHGDGLVVRKDGSVSMDRRANYFPGTASAGPEDVKLTAWALATSTDCPPLICDGKPPKEGFREP